MEFLKRTALELIRFEYEAFIILLSLLVFVATAVIVYWFYHRRKFRELSHQIPASVVNNYLDSIIQNSNALKSSLFRGGGLEIGEGVPSVVPVQELPAGDVGVGGVSPEVLNQKNAEIASLTQRLAEKETQVTDLEKRLREAQSAGAGDAGVDVAPLHAEIEQQKGKIAELEAALAAAKAAGGGGGGADTSALEQQLSDMTKERDELKEKLMEYEIIEEDLANLKRLQQENDQLKSQLAAAGGEVPAPAEPAPAAEAAPEPEPEPAPEPAAEAAPEPEPAPEPAAEAAPEPEPEPAPEPVAEPAAEEPAAEAAAVEGGGDLDIPENEGEQKSAEELLSEFEKMLG